MEVSRGSQFQNTPQLIRAHIDPVITVMTVKAMPITAELYAVSSSEEKACFLSARNMTERIPERIKASMDTQAMGT